MSPRNVGGGFVVPFTSTPRYISSNGDSTPAVILMFSSRTNGSTGPLLTCAFCRTSSMDIVRLRKLSVSDLYRFHAGLLRCLDANKAKCQGRRVAVELPVVRGGLWLFS